MDGAIGFFMHASVEYNNPLIPRGTDAAGLLAMLKNIVWAISLALLVSACGQGGREPYSASSRTQPPATDGEQNPSSDDPGNGSTGTVGVIVDPIGELLEPTGLGYRVDTWLETEGGTIHQEAYGVDLLPVSVDVDDDAGTGNLLGADISVHFITLLLYARGQIDVFDGAPDNMKLKVEITLLDPRNLLGLPGLLGVVDPDLRIALGMDAREAGVPESFVAELLVLDSLFSFLPRFTSAQFNVSTSGGGEAVAATLAMFADRAGQREDTLELTSTWRPAVSEATIDVVMTPDVEEATLDLTVSSQTAMAIEVLTTNGLVDEPTRFMNVEVALNELSNQFHLALSGVDGFDGIDGIDTEYAISTDQSIENLSIGFVQGDTGHSEFTEVVLGPLPTELTIVQTATGGLNMVASDAITDISFAQSANTPIVWSRDTDPEQPFVEHVIRFSSRDDGSEVVQARLAGLQSISVETDPDLILDGDMQAAALQFRDETEYGFVDARLDRLPGQFSVRFPDDSDKLSFSFDADSSGPGLHYEKQNSEESTVADIRPLPQSFSLCAGNDDACGSHGRGTIASINFQSSEPMLVNYHQKSSDGKREIAIDDLYLSQLAIDAGTRSGASKGYLYFDTAGEAFYGTMLQRDGGSGLYLRFSEGTYAVERSIEYKNYVQISKRRGEMKCPGREDLELRSGGTWYDLDFILDQLCQ